MKKHHYKRWLLAAALLGSSVFTQPLLARDLNVAIYMDITGMDPHDTSSTATYSVQSGVFERLFGFDKDMKLIPVLATDYSVNDDATQVDVTLREGVTFHDGTPFNAEAVKANLDRLANQDNKLKRNSLFKLVKETKVIDDTHVEILLSEPFGAIVSTLAHPSAVMQSPKVLASGDKEFIRNNPVGTGPFKFVEYKPNQFIKLAKNDNYWQDGWPKVDNVTFYPTPEAATRVAKLLAGEVDAVYFLDADLAKKVEEGKNTTVQKDPGIMQFYVAMNNLKKELSDKRVRQAINYAVDKNVWLKVVFGDMGNIAVSPIPPRVQFHQKQDEAYAYDLDKAKALMKEAGYADGFDVEIWSSESTDSVRTAQILKQQLSKINIRATLRPMDSGSRNEKLWSVSDPKKAEYDMYVAGWSTSTGDADWVVRPLFTTESWVPTAYNVAYYSNPDVDAEVSRALQTADPAVRADAYAKAQKMIWEDQPVVFLGEPDNLVGKDKSLSGVYMLPDRSFSFNNAAFAE